MLLDINYKLSHNIPALAWAADYELGSDSLHIIHGSRVETSHLGVVEGAWNGDFSAFDFHQSSVFAGTGFCHHDDEIVFCSSTDRLCPIFSREIDGRLHVSNSPVFLMARTGASPIPAYPYYHFNLLRISRQGLHCLDGHIPLAEGAMMKVHFAAILAIDIQGKISYRSHDPGHRPESFDDYHSNILTSIQATLKNALHKERQNPMASAAAISSGYDATACAALARDAGCQVTHTFYDSSRKDPHGDSGAKNARSLGMQCLEYDRWGYLESDQVVEAEFGFNASNSSVPMTAMETDLADKIYIAGSAGDTYWTDDILPFTENLTKAWTRGITGISQLEFRLRVGYCIIAPAYISARHTEAMQKILTAQEMKQWSVGGDYDRPVPRRIAEEAGVPREQFGIKKDATSHVSMSKANYFSKAGVASYTQFKKKMQKRAGFLTTFYYYVHYSTRYYLEYRLLKRKRKVIASTTRQRKYPFLLNSPPLKCHWDFCFLFQWMFDELKERYR